MLHAITLASMLSAAPSGPNGHEIAVTADAEGVIEVVVRGLRNADGDVLYVLFDDPNAFPGKSGRAVRKGKAGIKSGVSRYRWKAVPHATYAISVIHDENRNQQLDTNFMGMPKEGVGASNNPRARMGPPKWKDAKFDHTGEATAKVIKMTYLL